MLVGGWGSINLYHSVWEPPIMCVAWKISPSLGCYVDNESMPLKILFISISKPSSGTSTNPCFPLRRAYLFTFMLSHHPSYKKAPAREHTVICIHYYWFILGMTWLDLFYHELQCLVSPWSLKVLCIYVLRSQKGLARYHLVISYYDCFEKVLSSEIYYYGSLVHYAIDMSKLETYALLWMWLVIIFAENLNAGFTYLQQQEQTEFVKVFLYHFQFVNWIAWGQAKV